MKSRIVLFKIIFASGCILVSCSTSTFSVRSNPDKAMVKVNRLGGAEVIELGETPIEMDSKEFIKRIGGDTPFVLNIEKEGYDSTKMVVTGLTASNIALNQDLKVSSGFEDTAKTNVIIEGIFEAQRLARARRFQDALKKIEEVKAQTPQVAVLYELEGGIYYIEKEYHRSMDAYSKAIQYNPTSAEALQMLTILAEDHGLKRIPDEIVQDATPEVSNRQPAQTDAATPAPAPSAEGGQ